MILAIVLIVLVLLQHGKGADMGAAFGSGSAGSLFGASGSANFLSRFTGIVATLFFISSMSLTYLSTNQVKGDSSIMNSVIESDGVGAESSGDVGKIENTDAVPDNDSNSKVDQIPN